MNTEHWVETRKGWDIFVNGVLSRQISSYRGGQYVSTVVDAPSSLTHQCAKTVTDAQIKALPTTSIALVPAPGANRLLIYVDGLVYMDASGGAYTNIDAAGYGGIGFGVDDVYLSAVFANDEEDLELTNFLADGFSLLSRLSQQSNTWFSKVVSLGSVNVNEPFLLWVVNDAGDFTGGHANNRADFSIEFRVYDLTTKRLLTTTESGWNQTAGAFV